MHLTPTLRKASELSFVMTAVATLILAGCGGGGGSSTNSGGATPAATTTTTTITPFKGQFFPGATVGLKDAHGNPVTLSAGGIINASGVASVTFPAGVTYPLIVEVSGSYFNENTGTAETSTAPIRSLIQNAAQATTGVPVTIVTETAVADLQTRLGGFAATHPIQAASAVAALNAAGTLLGVPASAVPAFDPVTHQTSDANTLKLAAWAVAANGQTGATLSDKVKAMATALVNPAATPTTVVSQGTFDAALAAVKPGGAHALWSGVAGNAPTSVAIPTSGYSAIYASAVAAAGAGGTTGGTGGTVTPPVVAGLMGGAIQGTPLALAGTASTFAGKSYALDGTAALATFNTPRGITSDGTNLYVVDTINQRIRKTVIATGDTTTLAGTGVAGATDGPGATATFVLDTPLRDGITNDGTSLYVLDGSGSKIRKIDMATGVVSTLVPSSGTVIATKIIAAGGALYGAGLNRIIQINTTTGAITTVAGSLGVIGALDGTGTAATFGDIYGIASDGANLYVSQIISGGCCTPSTYAIRKVAISTWAVTTLPSATYTWANNTVSPLNVYGNLTTDGVNLYLSPLGGGLYKINMATGASTLAWFGNTTLGGLAIVGADLFATDVTNNQIQRIATATGVNTSLVGMAGRAVDGPGLQATFGASLGITGSTGVTTDGANLYVADTKNNKIRKIVIATGDVSTLTLVDGTGAAVTLSSPQAITTDGTNLYVSDGYLRKIAIATGVVTNLTLVDSTGANVYSFAASSLTTDGTSLYGTNPSGNTISKVNLATLAVTTFAGSGVLGTADGTGTLATFSYPVAITTDGTNLYVADRQSNLIRRIAIATGVVTTVTTSPAATMNTPFYVMNGITSDGLNLYVTGGLSWYSMDAVWKMEIATGVVTKVVGAPSVDSPNGITTDGTSLFVVDANPRVIRKIQ